MELIADTSVFLAVAGNEPEKEELIDMTLGVELLAPFSVHWEVGNALSAMLKKNRLDIAQAEAVLASYASIPVRFVDVDIQQSLQIAAEFSIYAYDAYLLACARSQRRSLITLDKPLRRIAERAGIRTVEIS